MKNVIELTEERFANEVLGAELPVAVDFYAPWCGPCKMLAPLLEQVAAELQGRLKFVKVNVDDAPGLAGQYEITAVPTLVLFRGGEAVDSLAGLAPPKALWAWLEGAAKAGPKTPAAVGPK
jgi:thioredoxin 1